MGILAIYDITGIQNFIFSTPKLKEIIGASSLVADILEMYLPEILKEIAEAENVKIVTKWAPLSNEEPAPDFQMVIDESVDAEILYIGGGNAWVAYKEESLYKRVHEILSLKILEKTYQLRLAGVGIATDFADTKLKDGKSRYMRDSEELQRALRLQKSRLIVSGPAGGLSITKRSVMTGQPVVELEKEESTLLSRVQVLKRDRYEQVSNSEKDAVTEFDAFTLKGEDSLLAVAHIDGNNFGTSIGTFMKEYQAEYRTAIPAMRSLSYAITNYYRSAMKRLAGTLNKALESKKFLPGIPEDRRKILGSFRTIILNGDDITLVCNGRVALALVKSLLKDLSVEPLKVVTRSPKQERVAQEIRVSACAGICYFPSHFPFSIAYRQAEDCCTQAKLQGRKKISSSADPEPDHRTHGSWVDFFVNASGVPGDVEDVLEQLARGKKDPSIGGRPYCVDISPETDKQWLAFGTERSIERFERLSVAFRSLPRGKSKSLRDALAGQGDAKAIMNHMVANDHRLPDISVPGPEKSGTLIEDVAKAGTHSIYFDVLEMMDVFEIMPQEVSGI